MTQLTADKNEAKKDLKTKSFKEAVVDQEELPSSDWDLTLYVQEDCMGYVAWNSKHRELIVVDPRREHVSEYIKQIKKFDGYRSLFVFDTHTHADHISGAFEVAQGISAPLFVSSGFASKRVHCRVMQNMVIPFASAPAEFILSPGHTADSITLKWGPFVFTGDTVLYGDVGRDDLPTGNPEEHYATLITLKKRIGPSDFCLPGHDNKGGRLSTWATQMKVNSSLIQDRESFVAESLAFDAPAPSLFKKSLVENFK